MSLLPRTAEEFSSAEYWERFFKKRGEKAFEWYGDYNKLCGVLHKYIKLQDQVNMLSRRCIGRANRERAVSLREVCRRSTTRYILLQQQGLRFFFRMIAQELYQYYYIKILLPTCMSVSVRNGTVKLLPCPVRVVCHMCMKYSYT